MGTLSSAPPELLPGATGGAREGGLSLCPPSCQSVWTTASVEAGGRRGNTGPAAGETGGRARGIPYPRATMMNRKPKTRGSQAPNLFLAQARGKSARPGTAGNAVLNPESLSRNKATEVRSPAQVSTSRACRIQAKWVRFAPPSRVKCIRIPCLLREKKAPRRFPEWI